MTHTVAKLLPWSSVKGHVEVLLKKLDPEDVMVMVPYGLQLVHSFRHPHVLRCMSFYHSTKGNTFVTHIDSGASLIMYTWTISSLDEVKVECQKFRIYTAINHLLSVPQHRVFIGFCSDMSLRVFTDVLHKCSELSKTEIPTSVLCMAYNEDMDELVTGGHGSLQTWKMAHVELRDPLTPGRPIDCGIRSEDWVRDIRVFQKQRQLVALCNEGIYMIDYVTNQQVFHMPNWHDTALTSFVWYRPLEYFITASMDGTIKVWNAIVFSQVHEFIGHYNCVTGLVTHPTDPLLISGSKDGTLRIWRLDTFQLTQRIDVADEILGMRIAHGDQLYYFTLHDVKVWNFNQFHHLFTPIQSCIHKLARIKCSSMPSRILCAAEDGSVRLISSVSGSILTIIYPMATYQVHTDIVYDPSSHRIYTALNSGDILVFDTSTNPCQARELWVPPVADDSILCLAMVKLDCALGRKESDGCESLIFGGHNSGQISLLEAKRSFMRDTVQGHCGAILAIESSHGTLFQGPGAMGNNADRLLSCGSDKKVNIWKLMKVCESQYELGLQCLSSIPCPVCPSHISMISNSVCLALPSNNSIVVCELWNSHQRTPNQGMAKADQHRIRRHGHLKDHDHTRPINGLCSCPSLGLFASSSSDGSVKIWDMTNTLVRELCFDSSLMGVCFANDHGDILVGFQNHISFVNVSSYLPFQFLEKLVSLHFKDESKEEPMPFNPDHQLWFDIERLPVFPTQLASRRRYTRRLLLLVQEHDEDLIKSNAVQSMLSTYSIAEHLSDREEEEPQRHLSSPRVAKVDEIKQRRQDLLLELPEKETFLETFDILEDSTESEEQFVESWTNAGRTSESDLMAERSSLILKKVWPIAPDGYIPNSILRGLMGYRHSPTPPPESPWVLKMVPGVEIDLQTKSEVEHSYEAHEPFTWASSSDDSVKLGSPTDLEDPSMGSPFLISPRAASGTPGRQSVEDQKLKLKSINLPKMLVIPTFEPTEALDKSTKGNKKRRKTRGINLTGGAVVRRGRRQSLKLRGVAEEDGDDDSRSSSEDSDEDDLTLLRRIAQEKWFPAGVSLDVESFIRALLLLLETTRDAQYRTVCNAVIDIYVNQLSCRFSFLSLIRRRREYNLNESLRKEILVFFEQRLASPRGVVRANAVRVMTKLGANREEVILKLIPKLVDDEEMVRQEAITAVDELAGIKTKEDLADYLSKIGLIKVYQNEDESVLRDLSNRYASEPLPPKVPLLQRSLQGHIVSRRKWQAHMRSRRGQMVEEEDDPTFISEGDSEITEWNQHSPQNGSLMQSSRRKGRRITKKKQKRRVDRPIRRKQTGGDLHPGEDILDDEDEESPSDRSDSEDDLDYQSDESSEAVRFGDVSRRGSQDVDSLKRLQNRRQTMHTTMLDAKAEMLFREKESMVVRMKEKLRRHRERYEKLVDGMSERAVQRKMILPVNPFYWRYYKMNADSFFRQSRAFNGSTSSLAARVSDSDSVTSDGYSMYTEEVGRNGSETRVLKEVAEVNKPSSSYVTVKTDASSGFELNEEQIESGFVESVLTSTIRVTDPDGRTLETWGSSGVYADSSSIAESIQVKALRSKVAVPSSEKRRLNKANPLTVANVKKHERLSAKGAKKENLQSRESTANRLAKAEADLELWRNFLKDQGKFQRTEGVASSSLSGTRPVILPCIPAGVRLTSQGGNQRLLYSISTGTDETNDLQKQRKSAKYSKHFGSSEFGKMNMIWTTLSPLTQRRNMRTRSSRPNVSLSNLPPVTPIRRREEPMEGNSEWLAGQMLYPSPLELNAGKRYHGRTKPSPSRQEEGVVYQWERPTAVVLPSIIPNLKEVKHFVKWKGTSLVDMKMHNSLEESAPLPSLQFDPPCTPIVPRNSIISSTKLPQLLSKLKTSC
ncbi:uncharacterized protein [Apostichopus japonicus]|uniref:uncharacterized protein isoform X2 n=1 Tax=Stichopus japonicus TaxID=307972 RepID=UPI003AB13EB6